ncbi:MAG: asparagine synthase-related protein, partial [Candidatus Woesebacteria bacterium]|nr:asparagine synthase-related protein [Candidatus Woesebacteria bacterium]
AFEKIVPKENLYRPKMGFTIPLDKWFSGELNSYAKHVLLNKRAFIKNSFNINYIKSMIEDNNKKQDFGPRLWALMSLELWYKAYFN